MFHAYDPLAPLGLSGARYVPIAKVDPASCLDVYGGLTLGPVKGFDLAGLHTEIKTAIELLRTRIAPAQLQQLDLTVILDDPRIALPRKHLLVAKWWPDHYESYVAAIDAQGPLDDADAEARQGVEGERLRDRRVSGRRRRSSVPRTPTSSSMPWHPGVY